MTRIVTPTRRAMTHCGDTTQPTEVSLDEWAARIARGPHMLQGPTQPRESTAVPFARGTCDVERLRAGITLCRYDMRYLYDTDVTVELSPHAYVGVLLGGAHHGTIDGNPADVDRVGVPMLFASALTLEGVGRFRRGQVCRTVGINIDDAFFERLDGCEDDAALLALRCVMRQPFVWRDVEDGASLLYRLREMAECPYGGLMACLHCESQALSVLVELADRLSHAKPPQRRVLRKARRERVQHVRHLVDTHLEKPLPLAEIARRVGSNETTLRMDFKAVFGTTIFAYMRDRRLDVARRLVQEGQLQIARIAYLTGYASPASFSTAYRKRFGNAPSSDAGRA